MWQNKYVGIPYKDNGRTLSGMDCWGLARYVYNEEFNISLPSFVSDYEGEDRERISELIAQYREGWEDVNTEPKSGDIVLFRMIGFTSHIGIVTEYPYFLHAKEGANSSIERADSSLWEKRVIGVFRYKEATKNNLVAVPNPLKTTRITDYIPEGATLQQVYETFHSLYGLPDEIPEKVTILVNGRAIPQTQWDYVVQKGDVLEYRAVPGKEVIRLVAVVALVYFTFGAAGAFELSLASMTGLSGGSLVLAQMGVMAAGTALINAIAPIRMPTMGDPGTSVQQNLINAANNTPTPYAPVPVVLGRVRMTPPVGATNYVEPLETEAYLRMLLVWGYGPIALEDIRIGNNVYTDYELDIKHLYGYGTETQTEIDAFNNLYGKDVQQVVKNIKLVGTEGASPWQEITFTQASTELGIAIHFPQGLRVISNNSGSSSPAAFLAEVQYDLVGSNTWGSNLSAFSSQSFTLPNSSVISYSESADSEAATFTSTSTSSSYYQWHTIYVKRGGGVFSIAGTPTEVQTAQPTDTLKKKIASALNKSNIATMTRLAPMDPGDIPLYDICVYNGAILTTTKRTEYTHTATISTSGLVATVSSGTFTYPSGNNIIAIGGTDQDYANRKDAFTYNLPPIKVPSGIYKIRVRRTNDGSNTAYGTGNTVTHDAYFYTATAFANNLPVTDPLVGKFARTAMRIKATDQLNGSVDGINALVTSICPDWDVATGTWITRTTNNPASLFRYVLQHPANAQRIVDSDLSTRVDLAQLQYWHAYCISKGFTFNDVLNNARSILDVLRDIGAAGRASPSLVDGRWTVIIDEAKTQVIQHFSTHNSWGFEAVKPLVKIPDAFKVVYNNESVNYVADEFYVYNTGKTASNAAVFEQLQLPGVTNAQAAFKHARWHLAQLKLRPETYSLNTDMEYLVCNRGDLVRVQHDVPSWGVGTARIKTYVNSTTLVLDNDVPLVAGSNYTIRIRTATGTSVTRTLTAIATSGYYSQISVTAALSSTEGAVDNLVLLGLLDSESQQCLVLSIEPTTNGSAKITMVDYTADMYNIDSSPDYPIPSFKPNITQYPDTFINTVSQYPTITSITSDVSAASVIAPGVYSPRIRVSYTETPGQASLGTYITNVELQWKRSADSNTSWPNKAMSPIGTDSCYATDIITGEGYDVRVRYVAFDGLAGPWTTAYGHTIVGKTINYNTPSAVTVRRSGKTLAISPAVTAWPKDFDHFEIRVYKDPGSGDFWNTADATIKTYTTSGSINVELKDFASPRISHAGTNYRIACRLVDTSGNYSPTSVLTSIAITTLF